MGRRLLITSLLLLAGPACSDQLTLTDGGSLSGEVVSMEADGTLTIEAEVATEPLVVRPDRIRHVSFGGTSPAVADHDARVLLANGDVLPCDLLGINDEELMVSTSFAGELAIPREVVSRMQLGIRPRKKVLGGIGDREAWNISEEDWLVIDGALVSSGTGHAGRAVENLPASFSISFTLAWEGRPSFKVFFCSDPTKGSGGKLDRYYLQFNTAGFELKRQSSGQTSYHPLGVVARGPGAFEDRKMRIELRVDRVAKMIHLFINGEHEGRFPDQLDDAPTETGIVFASGTKTDNGHRISDLEVREWDASGDRHKSEERGDETSDAVIDHDGQRFSGSLLETDATAGVPNLLFQSPHLEDPLVIPVDRISTIFLAGTTEVTETSHLFFGLGRNGRLSAASGRFDDKEIHLEHPLLGKLVLDRSAIASLDRRESEKPDPEEP